VTGFNPEFTELFRDETMRRLEEMDNMLLAIESGDAGADAVNSVFRNAHTIKGAAGMLGFPEVRSLAHAAEDVLARARESEEFPPQLAAPILQATSAMREYLGGSGAPIDGVLADLAASLEMLPAPLPAPASAIPPDDGGGGGADGEADGNADGQDGTAAADAGPVQPVESAQPEELAQPAAPAQPAEPPQSAQAPQPTQPALKVPVRKVDHLLDLAGEITQYRRGLLHSLGRRVELPADVTDQLDSGDRMFADLRQTAVGMRTLPLAAITVRMPRVVRDLARATDKDVEFVVTGADTELDRVILESLAEPLTHLLGNAVVHGIERPAERERAGKPRRGRLDLHAVPRGSLVEIVVADDGRGVSPEVIEQARHGTSLADLLAQPGYSTALEVTEFAGRGVGMDAVKAYVSSLGGTLEVRSEPGQGLEVVLLLPLALVLAEVLLIERGGAAFGVSLAAVEEVVPVEGAVTLLGQQALAVHGRSLPVCDLAELVGVVAPPLGERPPGIVVSAGGQRAIVACDKLLGAEEVVIKPLGPVLASLEGYLGASILADGRIALLLEPARLTRHPGPAPDLPAPGLAVSAGPVSPAPAERGGMPKILVVEDSFTVRELQRSILETAGYQVVTAREGHQALRSVDRDAEIALVLADLEMPGLNGVELTRAIRARGARSSLPIVILTKHGSDEDKRRGLDAGADAYMVKENFDQQDLLATVERLVGRS
jgi:two-component system chemotaxis sensor kinase CheA